VDQVLILIRVRGAARVGWSGSECRSVRLGERRRVVWLVCGGKMGRRVCGGVDVSGAGWHAGRVKEKEQDGEWKPKYGIV
jgi:hypothetical protein